MNICRDCNQDHSNQIADFPIGATVVVTGDFIGSINAEEYDYRVHTAETAPRVMITEGSYGQVLSHCEDGRAVFEFEAEKGKSKAGHTFHHPETYFRIAEREAEAPPEQVEMQYPNLERNSEHHEEIITLIEFAGWLNREGYIITQMTEQTRGPFINTDHLILRRFGIDSQQLDVERRALLKEQEVYEAERKAARLLPPNDEDFMDM